MEVLELHFVSVSEIDDALVIGFADQEFETTQYLLLQRSLDPHDDDGVYVERDGQQYSGYGTVDACTLARHQIDFTLDRALADALAIPQSFAIKFRCTDAAFEELRAGLPRIFAGTACALTA
jgi:hypothetical protein